MFGNKTKILQLEQQVANLTKENQTLHDKLDEKAVVLEKAYLEAADLADKVSVEKKIIENFFLSKEMLDAIRHDVAQSAQDIAAEQKKIAGSIESFNNVGSLLDECVTVLME